MFCQNCGAQIENGVKFCTQCGSKVPDEVQAAFQPTAVLNQPVPTTCKACGAPLREGDAFCITCGHPIAADEDKTAALDSLSGASVDTSGAPFSGTGYAAASGGTSRMPTVGGPASVDYRQPVAPEPAAKKNMVPFVIIGVVVVVALVVAALFAFGVLGGNSTSTTTETTTTEQEATSSSSSTESTSTDSSATEEEEYEGDSGYILPDSDSRYYTEEELNSMDLYYLWLARNEIFARHGRGFNNTELQEYFNSTSWYTQRYTAEEFDAMASPLNAYEKANSDLMLQVEKNRNSPYLT